MVKLIFIPKELINNVWIQAKPDIEAALERSGNYANSNHIKNWCNGGQMQLWLLWDEDAEKPNKYHGLVVTEIIKRPLIKVCNIRIMTGKDRLKWQHHIKYIEDFAKENKCDKMELIARPGWERVLKQFNYTKSHVVLDKNL